MAIENYKRECLTVPSRDILRRIEVGDSSREDAVPKSAALLIKNRGLFGYKAAGSRAETKIFETEGTKPDLDAGTKLCSPTSTVDKAH